MRATRQNSMWKRSGHHRAVTPESRVTTTSARARRRRLLAPTSLVVDRGSLHGALFLRSFYACASAPLILDALQRSVSALPPMRRVASQTLWLFCAFTLWLDPSAFLRNVTRFRV